MTRLILVALLVLAAPAAAQEGEEEEPAQSAEEERSDGDRRNEEDPESDPESEIEPPEPPPPSPLQLAQEACAAQAHQECVDLCAAILAEDRLVAELPWIRTMRLEALLALDRVPEARTQMQILAEERRADWSLMHAGDPALLAEADRLIQEGFLRLARADYAAGRFEEAYVSAVRAAEALPGSLPGRLACELAIHTTRRMGRAGHDGVWTDRRLRSLDRFVMTYPDDFVAQDILLESGELLVELGRHEEALPRLDGVVLADPSTPAAADAAELLVGSLQALREWAGLARTAEMLLSLEAFGTPELRLQIAEAGERASFHLIEAQHVHAEDWLGAAEAFQAFAEQSPDSDLADRALYNAIVFYYKAGKSGTASHLAKVLRRKFPHSPYIDRLQL